MMAKKAHHAKRALLLILAITMAISGSATAFADSQEVRQGEMLEETGYSVALHEDGYIVPITNFAGGFTSEAREMQARLANANYRSLSMTPGGDYSEMRFTWHSRSEVGAIRIYNAGILVDEIVASSRQLGHSFAGIASGVNPQPRNTVTASHGHPALGNNTWFTAETAGNYWVHQVTATNLLPGTAYTYVLTGGQPDFISAPKTFRTAHTIASARVQGFTFTAAGDPQIGVNDSFRGHQNTPGMYEHDFIGWTDALRLQGQYAPHSDFMLLVGDQVHNNGGGGGSGAGDVANRARSQFMYDILLAPEQFHSLPIVPVIGNHERGNVNGSMWHYHYNTPIEAANIRQHEGGSQAYLRFDYYIIWGNMLLIQLDSETRNMNAARQAWVQEVIDTYQDQVDWTVATWHRPIYSVHRHTTLGEKNDMINNWLPFLDTLGIDVIFNGHCHVYSRTHMMYNHRPVLTQYWVNPENNAVTRGGPEVTTNVVLNPEGTLNVALNSGSGSGFRSVKYMGLRDYIAAYNQNFVPNFSVINVDQHTFEIRTYQIDKNAMGAGTVSLVDTFTIVKNDTNTVPAGVNLTENQLVAEEIISAENLTSVRAANDTAITADALGLPSSVIIETNLNNNLHHYADTRTGIVGTTGSRDRGHLAQGSSPNPHHPNYYGVSVRVIRSEVLWDFSSIPTDAEARADGLFTVTGTIVPNTDYTRAFPETFLRGSPTASVRNSWWYDDYYEENIRFRNWTAPHFGTPHNVHIGREIINPNNVTVQAQVFFGNALPDVLEAPFNIAELGVSEFHHMSRTNSAFPVEAFDIDAFSAWPVVKTATGFGGPRLDGGTVALHRNSGVSPRPHGGNANETFHFFSKTFVLPDNFNANGVTEVFGSHRIDDNLVLFVNGIEIYRMNTSTNNANVRIGEPINWGTFVGHNTDAQHRTFNINGDFEARNTGYARQANANQTMFDAASRTNLLEALQPGVNVLTAAVGDNSAGSSDLWFDLELVIGYDALQASIADAQSRVQTNYTSASWTRLRSALRAAENVHNNPNATPAQLASALRNLNTTLGNLVSVNP